ncbi:hypothetical protein AVEN_214745-1 [Araneus ventricosus]|uniref:Uncharacterized protein n=1 Tax=Araneus ventricosus TaxID=182803 RepID=A0A4Y2IFA1_ARAVE|nr:hypothetical protein AVEN_214745-1 [Araneus ventricosus]
MWSSNLSTRWEGKQHLFWGSLGEATPAGCSCGGIGTAVHYATECIYTVSWHMRKPAPNFEQEWPKRVVNNLVSRHKIRGIFKFMSENRDLFRLPNFKLSSELN